MKDPTLVARLYSPHPPEAYTRPDTDTDTSSVVGVGTQFRTPERQPVWNLFWLSEPSVDHFLLDDPEWAASPVIDFDMLTACFEAVQQELGGVPMEVLLSQGSAGEFAEHLRRHDHQHLAPFRLRGEAWVMTVSERAAAVRGALIQNGNVVTAAFTRKPSLLSPLTGEPVSATIMPLALRMKMQ